MNRDNIIRMAREAGVAGVTVWSEEEQADVLHPDLEHFAALVSAAEREECAKIAFDYDQHAIAPAAIADAIRARGKL